jgi:uncharacterized protein (DUF2267 family)
MHTFPSQTAAERRTGPALASSQLNFCPKGTPHMTTATSNIWEHTIQASAIWITDLMSELGWHSQEHAYHVLRSVLHALRDRLPIDHVAAFAAQLPMLVRGMYYEGWQPAGKPLRERKKEEFLSHIASAFPNDPRVDAEQVAAAVFRVIERQVSAGEVRKLVGVLPRDIQALWT